MYKSFFVNNSEDISTLGSRFSKSPSERERILYKRKEQLIQTQRKRYIERQKTKTLKQSWRELFCEKMDVFLEQGCWNVTTEKKMLFRWPQQLPKIDIDWLPMVVHLFPKLVYRFLFNKIHLHIELDLVFFKSEN